MTNVASPRPVGTQAATDAFWLILTSYVGQLLTLGLAFALRRQLGPTGMGYVTVTTLVATYAPYVSLGAIQAAEREIALALGRGEERGALELEAAGSAAAFCLGLLAAAAMAAVAALVWSSDSLFGLTLLVAAAVVLLQQLGVWATMRMRTRYHFRTLGWVTAASAVAMAGLTVGGAILGGAAGALVAVALGSVVSSLAMARAARLTLLQMPARSVFGRLAGLGPGFLASGAATVLLGSVDQLAIGFLLGTTSLGLYSAAYLGYGFVIRVPTLIGSVIYPRLQQRLGASDDPRQVFELTARATAIVAVAMPAMVAVFYTGLPAVVYTVLPDYRPAIDPMRLLLLGLIGLSFGIPATQYLITVNRQWLQVAISVLFLAGMAGAYVFLCVVGQLSLVWAGAVDMIGYYAYGITLQAAAHKVAHVPVRRLLPLMPVHILTAAALLLGSAASSSLLGGYGSLTGSILETVVQALFFAPVWLCVIGLFIRLHPASRSDLLLLWQLAAAGAGRIARAVSLG